VRDECDVLVVGGGLAGLTAALTAARLGRTAVGLTGAVPGGTLLMIDRIEGLPGFPDGVPGYELCPAVQEQAERAGAELSGVELDTLAPADASWTASTADGDIRARAVVIASGARFRELGVPGEELLRGHGVSSCASCDGPLLAGKTAAVVGGGDSALQEALTLAESVDRVVIVHRGGELDAQASYRERVADHPAIEIRLLTVVEEILGDRAVAGVRVREVATGRVETVDVAGVFPYVGLRPNSERFANHVALDERDAIVTDEELRATEGVFAAGVVRSGAAGRAAAASGEGAAAALAADAYLAGRPPRLGRAAAVTAGEGA
jgi:thioredoxin reductase (NADPH)